MTDQQPPQGPPEFQPPGWQPAQPAPQPVPGPQPAPQPFPGPYQPPGQQWTPPPAPPRQKGGRGSIWLGIGITVAVLATSWGLTMTPYTSGLYSLMNTVAAALPFGLLLAGIVMAAIPRTTRTGAGILIGIGAGILIAGGLCFALVLGLGYAGR